MEGTRLRILQLLQKNNCDTVEGLARAIGLAAATIRRHLDILQRDRLVAFKEVRKKTGRPEYSFYLTDSGQEALPKNYDWLLGNVVQELSGLTIEHARYKNGQQILELVLQRLSKRIAGPYASGLAGKDLGQRLTALMGHLERADFYPKADVHKGMLQIRLFNCPFRSVALQNKAVCTFDLNLISSMLDLEVDRATCIHDGDAGCMYTVPVSDEAQKEAVAVTSG